MKPTFIVAQDATSLDVRMVGIGNPESITISDSTGKFTLWSRTQGKLWTKGETSGDFLEITEKIMVGDALVYRVNQLIGKTGKTCHTGTETCFTEREIQLDEQITKIQNMDYAKMGDKVILVRQDNSLVTSVVLESCSNVLACLKPEALYAIDCDNDTLLEKS